MEQGFSWKQIGGLSCSYWSGLWGATESRLAGMCVLKRSSDGKYYISGCGWGYPKDKELGPYSSLETAVAATEILVLMGYRLTARGALIHGT